MELPVYIILACYNGGKYIEKQLDSIIAQTHTNWRLLVRDDGSADNTVSIVKNYIQRDDRIMLVDEAGVNQGQGACQNFSALMKEAVGAEATIIMFCDQDDFWYPNKIELMLNSITSTGSDMVYSDFQFADEALNLLPEDIQKAKSPFMFPSFKSLLVQNQVYGCTMMVRGDLVKLCLPIPRVAENHDYWVSLVASGLAAKIHHLKEPLMLYRQHGNNVTGSFKDHYALPRIKRFLYKFDSLKDRELKKILMLKALYQQHANSLEAGNKILLEGYFDAFKKGRIGFIRYCIKNKIKRQSFLSTIVYFIVLGNLDKTKIFNR